MDNEVKGADELVILALRGIGGGDVSEPNTLLIEAMIALLQRNIRFVYSQTNVVQHSLYCFLRTLQDHVRAEFAALRAQEIEYCNLLLRECFGEFVKLGRDGLRLLLQAAQFEEFQWVWRAMLHHPESLSPSFQGVQQLLRTRTSRQILGARVTPLMQKHLMFLLTKVSGCSSLAASEGERWLAHRRHPRLCSKGCSPTL